MAEQLIVCGKSKEEADELATKIWLALLDNLEDTKHTFSVLKSIAQEYDVRENLKIFINLLSLSGISAGFSSISIFKTDQSSVESV